MAYDKERFDEIQAMAAGDLVHTMLVEFDPHYRRDGEEPGEIYMQPIAYMWAAERLSELLPPPAQAGGLPPSSDHQQ